MLQPFSVLGRGDSLQRLSETHFDLIVVGGGINGAGIARDAAMRGLKVAVLEKGDFASGTSSKSSKLVHGGVRYLEHFQFHLVHEASIERGKLLRMAPHVVQPLGFLMPVFKGARYGPFFVNLGLWLYDALSMFGNVRMHRSMGIQDFVREAPGLRTHDLLGGALFYDAKTDDSRLTLETLRSAHAAGARSLTHAAVRQFHVTAGKVTGVEVEDLLGGQRISLEGRIVVNATGPWSDRVRAQLSSGSRPVLRATKGIHVILPAAKKDLKHAVVLISPADGRILFAIPWEGCLMVGTTDTDFDGDPDNVSATSEEVDYVLSGLMDYFPDLDLKREDVIASFAGLRPLMGTDAEGASESAVSREHKIIEEPSGVLTLVGGKLTTYRKMAEQVVDRVVDKLKREHGISCSASCRTGELTLRSYLASSPSLGPRDAVDSSVLSRLASRFPGEEGLLVERIQEDPTLAEPVAEGAPYLKAEVEFACRQEMAASLPDLMIRRLLLHYRQADQGLAVAPEVARIAGSVLGWNDEEKQNQLSAYEAAVRESRAFQSDA